MVNFHFIFSIHKAFVIVYKQLSYYISSNSIFKILFSWLYFKMTIFILEIQKAYHTNHFPHCIFIFVICFLSFKKAHVPIAPLCKENEI